MVICVFMVFAIISNASMNNFVNMLFLTGRDIYSGWIFEIGTLGQRINILAKLFLIRIVLFFLHFH